MIQINDNDLPITAAEKLINGTRPYKPTPIVKALTVAITGDDDAGETQDMYSVDELKEIADYLHVYCDAHKQGD